MCLHIVMYLCLYSGHFRCATLINNYMPREEVTYYTIPEFTGSEPKLPPPLAELFYEFIMMVLINDNMDQYYVITNRV